MENYTLYATTMGIHRLKQKKKNKLSAQMCHETKHYLIRS